MFDAIKWAQIFRLLSELAERYVGRLDELGDRIIEKLQELVLEGGQ